MQFNIRRILLTDGTNTGNNMSPHTVVSYLGSWEKNILQTD